MLGMSRTLQGDSLIEYELVVLRQHGAGLTYQAHPSGQASTVFTAGAVSDSMVVFENPAHDFPQRIGYRRAGGDSLVAWIEGTTPAGARRVVFAYARAPCPGP